MRHGLSLVGRIPCDVVIQETPMGPVPDRGFQLRRQPKSAAEKWKHRKVVVVNAVSVGDKTVDDTQK